MANKIQPDWERVAGCFDLWLPYIAPVADTLLSALNAQPGERILDVACGTGEPALTLAKQLGPRADITAVDQAEGMVKVAIAKAQKAGLNSIRFQVMDGEAMTFSDGHFDALSCRFGAMLFDDSGKGLQEMARVLKPGGRFAMSVWGPLRELSSFAISTDALNPVLPEELKGNLGPVTSLGEPGALETILKKSGFSQVAVTHHDLAYHFDSFAEWWQLLQDSAVMAHQFKSLSKAQYQQARDAAESASSAYLNANGLIFPHTYLLAHGYR